MPRITRGGVAFGAVLLMFVAFVVFGGRLLGGEAVPRQIHFTTGGLHLSHRLTDTKRDNVPGHHT